METKQIKKEKIKYHLEFLQELFPWVDNEVLRNFSKTGNKELFRKIWNDDKFDWNRFSPILFSSFLDYLKIWWNPDKINWMKCIDILGVTIYTLSSEYNIVIRPEWFESYNIRLLDIFYYQIQKRNLTFSEIWDPDKFDWNDSDSIYFLFEYLANTTNFETWWDPERFNWKKFSHLLVEYFPDKFDIWWDPDKFVFTPNSVKSLSSLVRQYQVWFIPNKVKLLSNSEFRYYISSSSLIPFEEWYDPKYEFNNQVLINRGIQEEFDIWFPDIKNNLKPSDIYMLIHKFPGRYNEWIEVFEDRWQEISPSIKLELISFDENKWKERFRHDCKNLPNILKILTPEQLKFVIQNHDDLIFDLFSDMEKFLQEKVYNLLHPTTLVPLLEKYRKERFDIFKKVLERVASQFFGYYIDYLLKVGMKELWLDKLKEYLDEQDSFTEATFMMLCKIMELDPSLFRELLGNIRTKIKFTSCLIELPLYEISLTSFGKKPVEFFKQGIKSFGKENIDIWWDQDVVAICNQASKSSHVIRPEFFEVICEVFPEPEVVKKILFFEFVKEKKTAKDVGSFMLKFEDRTKYIHSILKYIDIFSDQEILQYIRTTFNYYNIFNDIPIEKIKALRAMDLFERTNLWND